MVAANELGADAGRFGIRRAANALRRVEDRRVEHDDGALATRAAVVGDLGDGHPAQLLGQGAGLANGCRREDELGVASVVMAKTAQATQHVRDVCAEHATQHMQFVDDDVDEAREERGPPSMAGKHGRVQHLWVGEHDIRRRPHPRALFGCRVTVVGAWDDLGKLVCGKGTKLILGERLGREQQQRGAGVAGASSRFGNRDLIAPRLARSRAGGNNDRMSGTHEVDGFGLVSEEALVMQCVEHTLANGGNGVREPSRTRWLVGNMGKPAVGGEFLDEVIEMIAAVRRHIRNRVFAVVSVGEVGDTFLQLREVDDRHRASIALRYDRAVTLQSRYIDLVHIFRRSDDSDDTFVMLGLADDVDIAALPAIQSAVDEAIDGGAQRLIIDLSQVSSIDSHGIGLLNAVILQCRTANVLLGLAASAHELRDHLTSADAIADNVKVYASLELARNAIGADAS